MVVCVCVCGVTSRALRAATLQVALASGETRSIPACTPKVNGNAVLRRHNEAGEAPTSMRARRQLPADYNGWLQVCRCAGLLC